MHRRTVVTVFALALAGCHGAPPAAGALGSVSTLAATPAPSSARLDGHAGDLVLTGTDGTALTFATTADLPGHRPLRGSIVDVRAHAAGAHADPISYWRAAWIDAAGALHAGAGTASSVDCAGGARGVQSVAAVQGVTLETRVCAKPGGRFEVTTHAHGLPNGAILADEINAGTVLPGVDRHGEKWSGAVRTRFLTLAEGDTALALEAPAFTITRDESPAHDDIARAVLHVAYAPGTAVVRTMHVVGGDALDALGSLPIATRRFEIRGAAHSFQLRDAGGAVLYEGGLTHGARRLHLPSGLGDELLFRDEFGVPAAGPVPLATTGILAPAIGRTAIRLAYTDTADRALPVHVLFRGLDGTPDPTPRLEGRGFAAGRSVYLLDGRGEVALAPGHYRLTASHGLRFTLAVKDLVVAPHAEVDVHGRLADVVAIGSRIAGDFHLHAAPSPDSHVPLTERVGALYCEGVDFAVATDHNHITDYQPAIDETGITGQLGTTPGEEITTFSPTWGHFIAYPLAPGNVRSTGIVPFFDTTPARIFADARARGAQVIQVNHGRMQPAMGYFDFTHLDAATGRADATFAAGFDAVEAFNGFFIEHPEQVRIGVQDLVGLVRRGMRPTATGNSDSHTLLYEEAGYPRTYVSIATGPRETLRDRVIDGMLHGRTTVSSGPFVELTVEGEGPGAIVRTDGAVRVHVRVSAPSWVPLDRVELWVDDRVAQTFAVRAAPADGVRFERDVVLPMPHDATVLAWADATAPLPDVLPYTNAMGIGFSGLVYVDADGDGRITLDARQTGF